jgi:hypothetical protein
MQDVDPKVIKVAVLVPGDIRPKDFSAYLDLAFAGVPDVLQFTVEGWGCDDIGDVTATTLMDAAVVYAAELFTEGSLDEPEDE